MALINNIYIVVKDEDVSEKVNSTSHPVEKGLPITDTIRRQPTTISLSGYIVDVGNVKANDAASQIKQLKNKGSLITYKGTTVASNMQIQSFDASYSNEVWGGMEFSMELKEVRIAKSAYTETKTTVNTANTAQQIKVGSIVIFKGGNVYVSSDAKNAAANRGRSTCKVTIISTASWSVHGYHLISTDGGKVYGWVDKANIEAISSGTTSANTNGGTQQVNSKSQTPVYHTVKSGDTIWALVNNNYKSLGKSCQWVIDNNPSAFSRKGDPTTLQIGRKLLMGYKS